MADKYLKLDSTGFSKEQEFLATSSGASDAGKGVALNGDGLIDPTMLGTTESLSMTASEDLSAGDFVNFWNDSGTLKVRKATNTGIATRADGYVKSSTTTGNAITVYRDNGTITTLSGLTIGSTYFLGTSGGVTTTVPTSSNAIVQSVGKARTTSELVVAISSEPIIRV